jgi:hypothetical protein
MGSATEIEQLNAVQYLYLRELSEPRDNSLKIVVEETVLKHAKFYGESTANRLGPRTPLPLPRGLIESVSDSIEREDDLTPSTVRPSQLRLPRLPLLQV